MVAPLQTTPTQPTAPVAEEIFYPDCDGQPIANNTEQFEILVLIKGNLDILFADDPNVFIAGDLFWYPIEGNNMIKYAPDILVALGRPKGKRYSYKQWEEGGQPPQVVFEILSPSNTRVEMDRKLLFYDHYGVEEYYIYDPAAHALQVWLRSEIGLDWVSWEGEWVSPRLGIRFDLNQEDLIIYRPDGQRFLNFLELEEQAEQARLRAEQESQRAEQESQRAERLAARLRVLGEDPDLL